MFDKAGTLALGCDHGGYALKEFLKIKLAEKGYSVRDFGTYSTDSMDYPDIAHPIAAAVETGQFQMAILICGSGNGICMTANKHTGIRAALCWNSELAALARQHNNANILCLPGRFISEKEGLSAAITFLTAEFEGGRHQTRIEKIPLTTTE